MLTVVILAKNEQERIGRAVSSVPPSWPLLVMDSFSTDSTLAEVKRCYQGAPEQLTLVSQAWKGFVKTRNESREWVKTDWVLWLDADEWLSPELCQEIQTELNGVPRHLIYKIPRQSVFLGRIIRHSGWGKDRKTRLGRTRNVHWLPGPQGGDVHEDLFPLLPQASSGLFRHFLGHEPFRDVSEQEQTNRRYSELLAEALAKKFRATGQSAPSTWWISLKVLFKFFENYVWKRGFLDGRQGWIICWGSARSLKWRLERLREILRSS
jgi:glycosyltransferase involved in cell wall biosynthesis